MDTFMKLTATTDEVMKYTQELVHLFGVRGISQRQKRELHEKFDRREFAQCIAIIRRLFGQLPRIKIIYVNDHPLVERISVKGSSRSEWESVRYAFERENEEKVRRAGGAFCYERVTAAKLEVDLNMPAYGTAAFRDFTFNMYLPKRVLFYPFELFVATMAHEMAHVLLFSVKSPFKNSEVATDVLAMIFGAAIFMLTCREEYGLTVGYLTTEQFYKVCGALVYHEG